MLVVLIALFACGCKSKKAAAAQETTPAPTQATATPKPTPSPTPLRPPVVSYVPQETPQEVVLQDENGETIRVVAIPNGDGSYTTIKIRNDGTGTANPNTPPPMRAYRT